MAVSKNAILTDVTARAFRVPTALPEADGTAAWSATTMILVEIRAAGRAGLGYTYGSAAARTVVTDLLAARLVGEDAFGISRLWSVQADCLRNAGWPGIGATALSATDAALWDLKAKILDLPLVRLLGMRRSEVDVYGSGGFTSYSDEQLLAELSCLVERDGCKAVKMKVGASPSDDPGRVRSVRSRLADTDLYVDANGAMTCADALGFAAFCGDHGVTWFEEPVSSDDIDGLRFVRERVPAGMEVAAGEYGYEPFYFRRLLERGAVDVLQADATRCGGITGFLKAAEIADAFMVPLSSHTAPALHLHAACAAPRFRIAEWFHDHARIERMLFDGAPSLESGRMRPDIGRPGIGLSLKAADAARFEI